MPAANTVSSGTVGVLVVETLEGLLLQLLLVSAEHFSGKSCQYETCRGYHR